MELCKRCGCQIYQDEHGTWIDNSGGDVCGVNGENDPHVPESEPSEDRKPSK